MNVPREQSIALYQKITTFILYELQVEHATVWLRQCVPVYEYMYNAQEMENPTIEKNIQFWNEKTGYILESMVPYVSN